MRTLIILVCLIYLASCSKRDFKQRRGGDDLTTEALQITVAEQELAANKLLWLEQAVYDGLGATQIGPILTPHINKDYSSRVVIWDSVQSIFNGLQEVLKLESSTEFEKQLTNYWKATASDYTRKRQTISIYDIVWNSNESASTVAVGRTYYRLRYLQKLQSLFPSQLNRQKTESSSSIAEATGYHYTLTDRDVQAIILTESPDVTRALLIELERLNPITLIQVRQTEGL